MTFIKPEKFTENQQKVDGFQQARWVPDRLCFDHVKFRTLLHAPVIYVGLSLSRKTWAIILEFNSI